LPKLCPRTYHRYMTRAERQWGRMPSSPTNSRKVSGEVTRRLWNTHPKPAFPSRKKPGDCSGRNGIGAS